MKYFVRYIADTSFSLGHRTEHVKGYCGSYKFNFSDLSIYCYEYLLNVEGRYVFNGIAFDSYVTADSVEDAQKKLINAVYILLALFIYTTLAPWVNLILIMTYNASDFIDKREAFYYFNPLNNVEVLKTIRPIDKRFFYSILTAFDNNKYKDSINASLQQLNKGLQADTDVDEFLAYWTGIEYLADVLNHVSGYKKEERYYTCPICGQPLEKCLECGGELNKTQLSPGRFKRVSEIARNKLNLEKKEFDKIVEARGIIIHGGKWNNFTNSIKFKETARTLLLYCIGELFKLNEKDIEQIVSKEPIIRNKITSSPKMVYQVELEGLKVLPDIKQTLNHPKVDIKSIDASLIKINDDGSINVSSDVEYLHIANEGIKFNQLTYNFYIHKKSGVKKADLKMAVRKKNTYNAIKTTPTTTGK